MSLASVWAAGVAQRPNRILLNGVCVLVASLLTAVEDEGSGSVLAVGSDR